MAKKGDRVRAYLLIKAMDPKAAQKALARLTQRKNRIIANDDDVVVRVEIVDCDFDLIVPVDVTDEAALKAVVGIVFNVAGVKTVTVARVTNHFPTPPVEAHCFIAANERGGAYPEAGRYPRSPGANPWG